MRSLLILTMGMFTLGFDAYVMAGLLPEIEGTYGVHSSQAGQLVTVFTLCYALSAPIFATLFMGKPIRRTLILALVLFIVGNGMSAFSPNFWLLILARSLAGIGAGLYSPLAASAAVSLVSEDKRGRALGVTLGGMSVGTVIGVPFGLFTAKLVGWQGTLVSISVFGIVALIGLLFWFPNLPTQIPPSLRERITMLTQRSVARTVGITFITSIASLGLYTYISSFLQSMGEKEISSYLWSWGIGGVLGSLAIGSLLDRFGRPGIFMGAILGVLTLSLFSIPLVIHIPILHYLPFLLWGAAGWASQAPQQHILLFSNTNSGSASVALNSSANYLGSSVGSMLGGLLLFSGMSPSLLSLTGSSLTLIALLIQIMTIVGRERQPSVK